MFLNVASTLVALVTLLGTAIFSASLFTPVRAPTLTTGADKDNCVSCHEDLYFLHDTGNWFCLRESPMGCVDCHGGDPQALTQELAHTNRAAHPVINEDLSKCEECHPKECYERAELFDQRAGISQVLVAAPYTPAYTTEQNASTDVNIPAQKPNRWIMFLEILPFVLVSGLALAIYFSARRRHT